MGSFLHLWTASFHTCVDKSEVVVDDLSLPNLEMFFDVVDLILDKKRTQMMFPFAEGVTLDSLSDILK